MSGAIPVGTKGIRRRRVVAYIGGGVDQSTCLDGLPQPQPRLGDIAWDCPEVAPMEIQPSLAKIPGEDAIEPFLPASDGA